MLSHRKAPKTQQICHYKHATKTSGLFLLYGASVGFNFRNNFANFGSFAKVSVPLQFIIPCLYNNLARSCLTIKGNSTQWGQIM